LKPALIAVFLLLAVTAYADDYEKWCPSIIEIYGVCSPELVANWLAHQNPSETIVPPSPALINATLGNTSAETGTNETIPAVVQDLPTAGPSSGQGCGPSLNVSNTLSTTSYLIGKTNVTYSVCVPIGANVFIFCDGFLSSRVNSTATKTISVIKKGAALKDFQKCLVYDRDNDRPITEVNTTTSAVK
jgi:hypothetical protein